MKLADLHKESSEEWSKKAGELEGVIKALEVIHLLTVIYFIPVRIVNN
jgi:nucleoprotein TPR